MEGMATLILNLFLLVVAIGILIGAASYLEQRAKKKGNLFSGRASPPARIIAFIFGIAFGGLTIYEALSFNEYQVVFPILALACFAYSLGWNNLMDSIQKPKK